MLDHRPKKELKEEVDHKVAGEEEEQEKEMEVAVADRWVVLSPVFSVHSAAFLIELNLVLPAFATFQ